MVRQALVHGVVEVDAWGVFTTHHRLGTELGELGELTLPAFGNGGFFEFPDGRLLEVEKTSWWRGWHELREDGIVVGSARSLGFWGQQMSVGFRGEMYELEPGGCMTQGWNLVDGTGQVLMRLDPRGVFRSGAYVRVLEQAPVDLVVFVYYLVHVRWNEQAAAAAAAGS